MFKKIIIDGEETDWSISKNGQVRNDKTGNFLKGTVLNGYRYFSVRWNKKQKMKSLHRLLAEAFIPNPNHLPVVDHIDGNRMNNSLDNLRWVTFQDNRINARPPIQKNKEYANNAQDGEVWKYFRNSIYQISNYGRVKNTRTNKISRASPSQDDGYVRAEIKLPGQKRKKFLVHRLVYETFIGEDYEVINHIDGNKSNNRLDNLEGVSQKDNMEHAARNSFWGHQKKIALYDLELNYIQTFQNTTLAGEFLGILPSSVRNIISARNGRTRNYILKYINEEEASTTNSNSELENNSRSASRESEDMV